MSNATDADYQASVGSEKTGAYAKESGGDGMSKPMTRGELFILRRYLVHAGGKESDSTIRVIDTAIATMDERDELAGIMREFVNAVKARDTHIGNGEVSPALATIARRLRDAVARVEEVTG